MDTIGAVLSKERKKKKISLDKASRLTKIKKEYLSALEKDDYNVFPEEIYVRSFLEKYASFLEIDAAALLKRYRETRPKTRIPLLPLDFKFPLRKEKRSYLGLLLLILGAVVVFAVAAFLQNGVLDFFSREDVFVSSPPEEVAPPPRSFALRLYIRAIADSHLTVEEEGRIVFDDLMSAGDEKEWFTDGSFTLDIGNPGGLELTVNDKFIGVIGRSNERISPLVVTPDVVYFDE